MNGNTFFGDAFQKMPESFRQVACAVDNKIQAPLPIIVTSMLSVLSSVAHGYINIEMPHGQIQPVSLFTLVIAESGDRKTSTDKLIFKPLFDYDRRLEQHRKQTESDKKATALSFKYELKNLEQKLKKAHSSEDYILISRLEKQISELYDKQPSVNTVSPKTIYSDATPVALWSALEGKNNAITLHSSDSASLFNRFNTEFISNTNLLWDGDSVSIARKTGEINVDDGRIVLSLMTQRIILERLTENKSNLLRLTGFYSRMLICSPLSLQGFRFNNYVSDSDEDYINQFYEKLEKIMQHCVMSQSYGVFETLRLNPEARRLIQVFADNVESQLSQFGSLADVRDAGSKIVNNACRIAALLHLYINESTDKEIDGMAAHSACLLAGYYLTEFKRLFGERTTSELAAEYGASLFSWLQKESMAAGGAVSFTRTHILQYGPNRLRKKEKLELAIQDLTNKGLISYWCPPKGRPFIQFPAQTIYTQQPIYSGPQLLY